MQTDSIVTQAAPAVSFSSLALSEPIQRAIAEKGYTQPSPIQAQAIPHLLQGRDIIGLAQTGSGKTAAFSLPMLHNLQSRPQPRATRRPRALILTPTRELAIQIGENIACYGRHLQLRHTLVYGGVGEMPQIRSISVGTDILVATPGRLLDLMQQHHVFLDRVEIFVLDEADRMLDMGFAPDVKRVVAKLPPRRQSLLFSATMPEAIRELANRLLQNPVVVEVARVGTTVETVEQKVCFVERSKKHSLLMHLLKERAGEKVLVFARTKHGADRIAKNLSREGVRADAIHGNKGQGARQRALKNFSDGTVPVLVATDIASRGIDVKEIELVVNFDLPEEPEAYVHRIGRTARAGASGLAISFCDSEERMLLRDIQRLIRQQIPADHDHPFASTGAASAPVELQQQRGGGQQRNAGHQGGRNQQRQHNGNSGFGRGRGQGQRQGQGQGQGQGRRQSDGFFSGPRRGNQDERAEGHPSKAGAQAPSHAPQSGHHHTGERPHGSIFTALRGRLFGRSTRG